MSLSMCLFGPFELTDATGRLLALRSARLRALAAYIAMAPAGRRSREAAASLLWGDSDEQHSRHSLNQAVLELRKALGDAGDAVVSDRDGVGFEPGTVEVDALAVLRWRTGEPLPPHDITRGAFLENLDVSASGFQDWVSEMRYVVDSQRGSLLRAALSHHAAEGRHDDAAAAGRALLSLSPLDEDVHRTVMAAHLAAGRPELVLLHYQQCREVLAAELEVEPEQETLALRDRAVALIRGRPRPSAQAREPTPTRPPWTLQAPPLPALPSIAVLPFEAADGVEFFADGITDDIIIGLSRFRSLFVISRSSSFTLRGATPTPEVASRLGVAYVLQGRVRRSGGVLRVTAGLWEAAGGSQVWAERYDRPLGDLFAVEDELAETIVSTLAARLERTETERVRRKPTESLAAYEAVLRGLHLLHRKQEGHAEAARPFFEQAVGMDPDYAFARVQLALVHMKRFFWDDSMRDLQAAISLAEEARAIDDAEPWAHMVLALGHVHRRSFEAALRHGETAARLNPNDAGIAAKLGLIRADLGEPDQGIALIERAMRLDPFRATSYCDYLGLALFAARRHEEALAAFQVNPEPQFYDHVWMAACLAHLGRIDEARHHAQLTLRLAPHFTSARFAAREPIRRPADLEHWLSGFRMAGIP
jgi:TolB-like protein/DNA-binding SARP family transcriptional activator